MSIGAVNPVQIDWAKVTRGNGSPMFTQEMWNGANHSEHARSFGLLDKGPSRPVEAAKPEGEEFGI